MVDIPESFNYFREHKVEDRTAIVSISSIDLNLKFILCKNDGGVLHKNGMYIPYL
jgi:hypothetical protein